MFRSRILVLTGCLAILGLASSARALSIAALPLPQRLAQTKVIVVGKVTAVEAKHVKAPSHPQDQGEHNYRVAVITIQEDLHGAKGLTNLRVGYIERAPIQPQGGPNGIQIRPAIAQLPSPNLKVGDEYVFLLSPHFKKDFYVGSAMPETYFSFFKKDPKVVASYKQYAKVLNDPTKALASKDANERVLAAAILVSNYRTYDYRKAQGKQPPTAPVDAAQSKRILETLASTPWDKLTGEMRGVPQQTFNMLGVTAKDGWKPVRFRKPGQYEAAVQKWLKANAGTYRIQRFVQK